MIPRRYDLEKTITKDENDMQILSKFSYLKKRLGSTTKENPMINPQTKQKMKSFYDVITIDSLTPISI